MKYFLNIAKTMFHNKALLEELGFLGYLIYITILFPIRVLFILFVLSMIFIELLFANQKLKSIKPGDYFFSELNNKHYYSSCFILTPNKKLFHLEIKQDQVQILSQKEIKNIFKHSGSICDCFPELMKNNCSLNEILFQFRNLECVELKTMLEKEQSMNEKNELEKVLSVKDITTLPKKVKI
jgi:hypothetical protein